MATHSCIIVCYGVHIPDLQDASSSPATEGIDFVACTEGDGLGGRLGKLGFPAVMHIKNPTDESVKAVSMIHVILHSTFEY